MSKAGAANFKDVKGSRAARATWTKSYKRNSMSGDFTKRSVLSLRSAKGDASALLTMSFAFAWIYFAVRAQHWNNLVTLGTVAPERKNRAVSAFCANVSRIQVAAFERGGGRED